MSTKRDRMHRRLDAATKRKPERVAACAQLRRLVSPMRLLPGI